MNSEQSNNLPKQFQQLSPHEVYDKFGQSRTNELRVLRIDEVSVWPPAVVLAVANANLTVMYKWQKIIIPIKI